MEWRPPLCAEDFYRPLSQYNVSEEEQDTLQCIACSTLCTVARDRTPDHWALTWFVSRFCVVATDGVTCRTNTTTETLTLNKGFWRHHDRRSPLALVTGGLSTQHFTLPRRVA